MKNATRMTSLPVIFFLFFAAPTLAFDYPLSETSVRDAFLTGNGNRNSELFAKYVHSFSAPDSGPYVASIRLETPYEQVAQRGATASNYHAEEAQQEFLGKRLPFRVSVEIQFTPTYPESQNRESNGAYSLLQPLPDYQNDFQIDVSQDNTITPIASRAYLASSNFSNTVWGIQGVVIEKEFDPQKIDSSDLTVDVHTPDGQDIATTFDLSQLR
ncbi:MAG TPA: hypothetical protein VIY69_08845 [Candidatus Acidoferrales bacterium]